MAALRTVDVDKVLARVDSLLTKGAAVPPLPPGQQQYGVGADWLQPRPFQEWRAQSLALLRGTLPEDHTYVQEFSSGTALRNSSRPEQEMVESGLGILAALREDLAGGHLASLRTLVSGEVFTDFMEMAEHLDAEGYYHAAASISGAVVEDALRRTLTDRGQKATGNLESMNQIALDTALYGRPVFLQMKAWIAVRNEADHGNWEAVDPAAVRSMIRDIPTFLVQQLGLA